MKLIPFNKYFYKITNYLNTSNTSEISFSNMLIIIHQLLSNPQSGFKFIIINYNQVCAIIYFIDNISMHIYNTQRNIKYTQFIA